MPNIPSVPVPTEDDLIPEDVTIEDTDFKETDDIPSSADSELAAIPDNAVIVKKEPKIEDVSGYIRLKVFINRFGQVDSVRVIENTTGSQECVKIAKRKAFSTRYIKRDKFKKKAKWIEKIIRF